jgi:hypothetical protein
MPRYKPPIGGSGDAYTLNGKTESQLNVATAEDASTLDSHDSTYFAESDGTPSNIFKIDSDENGPLFKNVSGHLEIRTFDDSGACDTTLGTLTSNAVYADSIKNSSTDDFEIYLDTRNESFTETSLLRITGTDSTISGGGFIETFINGVDPITLEEYSLFGRQSAQHKKSYIVLSSPYGGIELETSSAKNASLSLYDATSSNELVAFPSYITINSNIVWHAGNDGVGSGLDADLLDNKHANEFSMVSHSHTSFPTLNVGGSTDYASFATDGTIKLHGAATTWDDLRIEPVARTTGTNSPAFEKYFDNGSASRGVYLYSFDDAIESSEKEIFFTMQMPHNWAQTAIYLHVHWIPYAAGSTQAVRWGLEYNWANVNSTYGNTTIIYTSTNTAGDTSLVQNKHYRSEFDSITPTSSQNGMSSILIGRLFRNSSNAADTFTNKAGLLYIDAHYEINDLGSSTISTK